MFVSHYRNYDGIGPQLGAESRKGGIGSGKVMP
jgi:hypothetical protein